MQEGGLLILGLLCEETDVLSLLKSARHLLRGECLACHPAQGPAGPLLVPGVVSLFYKPCLSAVLWRVESLLSPLPGAAAVVHGDRRRDPRLSTGQAHDRCSEMLAVLCSLSLWREFPEVGFLGRWVLR